MILLRELLDSLWNRRSLQGRGLLLLTALTVVVVVAATTIVYSLSVQRKAVDEAAAGRERATLLAELNTDLQSQEVAFKAFLSTGQPSFLDSADSFGAMAKTARGQISGIALAQIDNRWADWSRWQVPARDTVILGQAPPSALLSDGGDELFMKVEAALQAEDRRLDSEVAIATATASSQQDGLRRTTIGAATFGLLMLFVIAWGFYRSTLIPIRRLVAAAHALAAGDSAVIPEARATGEVGQLARALGAWDRASRERLSLAQAMVEIGTEMDLDKVISSGSERLRDFLDATVVSVTVGSPESGFRSRLFMPGDVWHQFEHPIYPDGPSAQAASTLAPVATDLRSEIWPEAVRQYALAQGLGPNLALPLQIAGKLIGVVSVVRREEARMFTVAEVGRAELMIQPLAVAIHVATLFDQLRRANTGLLAASRHKSEFLATMSHELRTPLNSILGFSQLLESADFGELNERQTRYVAHIHSSGNHLLALINDVLDISKVEAGLLELVTERVNLTEAVDQCIGRMRPQADTKRLQLASGDLSGIAVNADPRRLEQVLLNLLSNAIKFTPEDGEVRINAQTVDQQVLLTVSDTGLGIAPEDLERVFEQFIQVRSGRTRIQEGTGLGLALSRRLAEMMGGDIEVHSEVGKGSVFTVSLPVAPALVRTPTRLPVLPAAR